MQYVRGCEITKRYFSVLFFLCIFLFLFLFSLFLPLPPLSFSLSLFLFLSLSLSLCYFILQFHFAKLSAQKRFYQNTTVNYLCAIRHTTAQEGEKVHETRVERITCKET